MNSVLRTNIPCFHYEGAEQRNRGFGLPGAVCRQRTKKCGLHRNLHDSFHIRWKNPIRQMSENRKYIRRRTRQRQQVYIYKYWTCSVYVNFNPDVFPNKCRLYRVLTRCVPGRFQRPDWGWETYMSENRSKLRFEF